MIEVMYKPYVISLVVVKLLLREKVSEHCITMLHALSSSDAELRNAMVFFGFGMNLIRFQSMIAEHI